MLRKATLALVHSTAEYCAPVWCHSAHARLIDPTINDALRIVTGCLRPTPANNLPILAGIQPAELRCKGATLSLGFRAMEPGHLLHSALTHPSDAAAWRLKLRHPFVPIAQQLISFSDTTNNIRAVQWANHQWNAEWADNPARLCISIPDTGTPPRMTLPRRAWVWLNRIGVGHFRSCLCKWSIASSAAFECDAQQTDDHVVLHCPIHRPPHRLHGLMVLDDETTEWLLNTCSDI